MAEAHPTIQNAYEQVRDSPWPQVRSDLKMRMALQEAETPENSRLNMVAPVRIVLAALASYSVGTVLGIAQGSKMAGLRFRAEHAHKLPSTPTGWFMYHKSKNYNMAKDGLKEGVKMGLKVSFWTTAIFFIENLYDEYRQSKDFLNTVMASLTVAGGFSLRSASLLLCALPSLDSSECRALDLTDLKCDRRQIQSSHDSPCDQDRTSRWADLRWPAGHCRRGQRQTDWIRRMVAWTSPV